MNNHILPFSCQASVKLYLLKHSCKETAITTEIKRNCLDGIHSNVLSLSHQILFYIIVTLITIKHFEIQQSRLTISNPTKLNIEYEYLSV